MDRAGAVLPGHNKKGGMEMHREEEIIGLIITMLEQSNQRMKEITRKEKDGESSLFPMDVQVIKLAQKEFEMQIKLLDKIVKNFKEGKGFIDITPDNLQKKG